MTRLVIQIPCKTEAATLEQTVRAERAALEPVWIGVLPERRERLEVVSDAPREVQP